MKDLFRIDGSVAVIIGGTGGLGGAMASALASAGASVAIVGRSQQRGQERVDQIVADGGRAIFQSADALDKKSLQDACNAIEASLGPVATLVNAAGGNRPEATLPPGADFCELNLDAWRDVFDLNLVGGVLLPCE